ncbi:hypothetical protein [Mycolicibacterium celeriflavum]|uniref:Uncharacterized protein n=1 Tax=Mycolicibacterium celeriflavum TaxID=1249101 RepID=A0A1X0BPT6_MYCCF|nr:hypothetical protein [Mycolicibacterium celeriflavum]MCV7240396.1 hypothetical protein [Mycolicibacterium celeriflavum]ORA45201.1 hypothetical protein BST21_17925 [Mycolicibacterium celeriflavum]BBY44137.1 hypothetical protein MCEL_24320 [Mycolicibacterium celeriflavum]
MSSTEPDRATVDEPGGPAEPGRPVVLESNPPGLWRALLGLAVGVLAPLFGFLVGSIFGAGATGDSVDPMFLSLFAGIVIGGIGLLVALSGGARLWRHFHRQDAVESEDSR